MRMNKHPLRIPSAIPRPEYDMSVMTGKSFRTDTRAVTSISRAMAMAMATAQQPHIN